MTVHEFVARLLSEYEEAVGRNHSQIATDMDIPVSNYYLYRNGAGNPTARTINKMIEAIQQDHPEIIIKVGMWYLRQWSAERLEWRDFGWRRP